MTDDHVLCLATKTKQRWQTGNPQASRRRAWLAGAGMLMVHLFLGSAAHATPQPGQPTFEDGSAKCDNGRWYYVTHCGTVTNMSNAHNLSVKANRRSGPAVIYVLQKSSGAWNATGRYRDIDGVWIPGGCVGKVTTAHNPETQPFTYNGGRWVDVRPTLSGTTYVDLRCPVNNR